MATHGTSMMLSQAVMDVRQCMARIDNHVAANRGDKAMEEVVTMQRHSVGISEMLTVLCDNAVKDKHNSHKPLSGGPCGSVRT